MKSVCDSNQRELLLHTTGDTACAAYLDVYQQNSYPWHWHDEMEISYIEQGSLQVKINHRNLELSCGEGIFINTGVLHAYEHRQKGVCRMPNVLFQPAFLYGMEGSVFQKKYIMPLMEAVEVSYVILRPDVPWQKHVLELIRYSHELCVKQECGYEILLRNALSDIILQLYLYCFPRQKSENRGKPQENIRMRKMMTYIQQYYTEPLTVERIAAAASVSKRECLRCFKNTINQSPMHYVREQRIEQAKKLLSNTTFTLGEISEKCGFQSQSYFTQIFRESVGQTPGEYRKRKRHALS